MGLTPRQHEVLAAVVETGSYKQAGHLLGLSEQTVKNQLWEARRRTGHLSTVQLAYALGSGELDSDD